MIFENVINQMFKPAGTRWSYAKNRMQKPKSNSFDSIRNRWSIESDNKERKSNSKGKKNARDENNIYIHIQKHFGEIRLRQRQRRRQHCTIQINWFQLLRILSIYLFFFSGNFCAFFLRCCLSRVCAWSILTAH